MKTGTFFNPFVLFFCLVFTPILANDPPKRDTVSAVVVYGEEMLLPSIERLGSEGIIRYKDSLLCLKRPPFELIEQVELYERIPYMPFDEVFNLIDSLFEMREIPYALINQINWYVAFNEFIDDDDEIDTTEYPADFYYNSWNTKNPNPYPVHELIASDTTVRLTLQGKSHLQQFVMPFDGVLTSPFGQRYGRNHNGVDIDLEVWDPVKSAFPGMVRVASYYGSYGRVVVVRHWNGLETLYAHLHRIKVKPGDIVNAGDVIGLGGSSGRSTGSHLHWEIRFKGVPLNPHHFIDFKTKELQNDVLVLKKTKYGYAAFPDGVKIHAVRKGDFLYKIAEQYGTSVNKLCQLNGIKRNTVLHVGQKLRVI